MEYALWGSWRHFRVGWAELFLHFVTQGIYWIASIFDWTGRKLYFLCFSTICLMSNCLSTVQFSYICQRPAERNPSPVNCQHVCGHFISLVVPCACKVICDSIPNVVVSHVDFFVSSTYWCRRSRSNSIMLDINSCWLLATTVEWNRLWNFYESKMLRNWQVPFWCTKIHSQRKQETTVLHQPKTEWYQPSMPSAALLYL